MIGTEADATLAATEPRDLMLDANGSTRDVYLINGVVYKVDSYSDNYHNVYESEQADELRPVMETHGVIVPKTTLYPNGVLAMEYIKGNATGECSDSRWLDLPCGCNGECIDNDFIVILEDSGWNDVAWGNAIKANGSLYLIDLA